MIEKLRELSKKYHNESRSVPRTALIDKTNERRDFTRSVGKEFEIRNPENELNRGTLPVIPDRGFDRERRNERLDSARGVRREPEFNTPEAPLNRGTLPVRRERGFDRDDSRRSAPSAEDRRGPAPNTARSNRDQPLAATAAGREGFRDRVSCTRLKGDLELT